MALAAKARSERVFGLAQSWEQRILRGDLAVDEPESWADRMRPRFALLTDEQLDLAERAASLPELELLFVEPPVRPATSLLAVLDDLPGNVTWVGHRAAAKANPTDNPGLYADLAFTAVTPCRILDSRFGSTPGPWAANTTHTVQLGPLSNYASAGGQTLCLGSGTNNGIAAVMAAVSTVSQSGPGYLVFFPFGASNPGESSVAQWFQPGRVQTSFVILPTQMPNAGGSGFVPAWSSGYIANASSHVIIDVVGYFQKANVEMWAVVSAAGALDRGHRAVGLRDSSPPQAGIRWVNFDRDVWSCAYIATLGGPGTGTNHGTIYAGSDFGAGPNTVVIETRDTTGALAHLNFHLKVSC